MLDPDLGHLLLLRLERHQVNRKGAAQFIKCLLYMFYAISAQKYCPKTVTFRNRCNGFPAIYSNNILIINLFSSFDIHIVFCCSDPGGCRGNMATMCEAIYCVFPLCLVRGSD